MYEQQYLAPLLKVLRWLIWYHLLPDFLWATCKSCTWGATYWKHQSQGQSSYSRAMQHLYWLHIFNHLHAHLIAENSWKSLFFFSSFFVVCGLACIYLQMAFLPCVYDSNVQRGLKSCCDRQPRKTALRRQDEIPLGQIAPVQSLWLTSEGKSTPGASPSCGSYPCFHDAIYNNSLVFNSVRPQPMPEAVLWP